MRPPPPGAVLVQADDLGGMPDAVLVDARPYGAYSKSHIPGAVNLDLFAFHWADTTPSGMEALAAQAARYLSFAGVSAGRDVVFYDDVSGMLAARGLWLCRYLSHKRSYMLDGGMKKWLAGGRDAEQGTRAAEPGSLDPRPDMSVIAGFGEIRDRMGKIRLVDARAPPEYDGTVARAASAGHIPGAVNIDWVRNVGEDGAFRDPGELRAIYGEGDAVTYCHGGYRAANAFVAMSLAGSKPRLYPGSWGEWGNLGLPASRG